MDCMYCQGTHLSKHHAVANHCWRKACDEMSQLCKLTDWDGRLSATDRERFDKVRQWLGEFRELNP